MIAVIFLIILKMSIYSGFATRVQQTNYNKCLCKIILLLQNSLLQLLPNAQVLGYQKITKFQNLLKKLVIYQEHKYLPPKFSELLAPLTKKLSLDISLNQKIQSSIHTQIEYQSLPIKHFQQKRQRIKTQRNQHNSKISNSFRVKTLQKSENKRYSKQKRKCDSSYQIQFNDNFQKNSHQIQQYRPVRLKQNIDFQQNKLKTIIQDQIHKHQDKGHILIKFPSTKIKKQAKTSRNKDS